MKFQDQFLCQQGSALSATIMIPIGDCYRFVRVFNAIFFVIIGIYLLVTTLRILPISNIAFMLALIIMYGLFLGWRRPVLITHVFMNEGDTNTCLGCHMDNGHAHKSFIMSELHCRFTYFGCWLAFEQHAQTNPSTQQKVIRLLTNKLASSKHSWVFIPRFLLSESCYKRICRHLIWHSV